MNCVAGMGMETPYSSGGACRRPLIAGAGSGLRQLDAIDHLEKRARARLDDVGAHAGAPVAAAIVLHVHACLALRVFALGHRLHLEFAQRNGDAGGRLDGLESGIDRAIARRRARGSTAIAVAKLNVGARHPSAAGLGAELDQLPRARGRALGAQHERLDVAVEELLLLVRERLELLEHPVELRLIELEAERLHTLAERMPAAVLAEHQVAAREAYILGAQNLIRARVLEHAVLMDAALVCEGVLSDHRLVARNRHAGDARDQARSRVQAAGVYTGRDVE